LGLRLAAYYQFEEGTFDRVHADYSPVPGVVFPTPSFDTVSNADEMDVNGFQAALRWAATDDLTFNARINYQDMNGDGFPYGDFDPDNTRNFRAFDVKEFYEDEFTHISFGFTADVGSGTVVGSLSAWDRESFDREDTSELITWLGFFAGIPAFIPPLPTPFDKKNDVEGQVAELRFASSFDGPIQVIAGVFYSDTDRSNEYRSFADGFQDAFAGLLGLPPGTPVLPDGDAVYLQDSDATIEELAVFGELSWDITEQVTATVGARWFDSEITSNLVTGGFAGGPTQPGEQAEDGINPKVAIEFSPTDDQLYYVSASKGFRLGGVNGAPVEFCGESLSAFGLDDPAAAKAFDSDELWNYEVGMKNSYAGGRFQLNGALFFIDWDKTQQNLVLDCGFGFILNSGAAESQGVELEGSFAVSESLLLSFGIGYVDAEVTEAGLLETPISAPGTPIQHVPELTATATVDYDFPIREGVDGNFRFDYSYVDESISFINRVPGESSPPTVRDAVNLINLRLGARWDTWELTLFADNVLDEITTFGDNRSLAVETPGRPRLARNQGRTIGLDVRYRF